MSSIAIYQIPSTTKIVLLKEVLRKTLHISVALVVFLIPTHLYTAFALLGSGVCLYLLAESMRLNGYYIPVINPLIALASRSRDQGGIVWGPFTLALGAMLALALFPPAIAIMAIFALTFGDGLASLVGLAIGQHRPVFLQGKSLEGCLACCLSTFIALYLFSGKVLVSLLLALLTTFIEALPLKNLDNIAIPLTVGTSAMLLLIFF